MFHGAPITQLLIVGLCLCSLASGDCPFTGCYCGVVSILCENKGYRSLPPSLATYQSNLTSLILDSNQITTIPARSLPANLTQISLLVNPIVTVDDAAFDASAFTLNALAFSYARFTRIPDALLHLHALTQLTIYSTDITDWNINAMKNIGQTLQLFYFIQYGLTTWPDCIQYFSRLTQLSLTSTSISAIPDNALDSMANTLTTLSLLNNSLTAVPKALSNLTALQMLYLDQNKIVDITWLPATAQLHTLVLDSNRISDANLLSNLLRRYADSLHEFSIENNQLTTIPDFSFLTKVTEFYIGNNRISDPYSGSVPLDAYFINFVNNLLPFIPSIILNLESATTLLLTSNIIHSIRSHEIPQWISMIELDHNLITEITDASFPVNSSLLSLSLNYNPVSHISVSAFNNLPLLTGLTIQGSKLTRVPLALVSLTNINFVDMSDSASLICTCVEKSLGPWMERLNDDGVDGNCGDISVYFFFVSLGPSCPTDEPS